MKWLSVNEVAEELGLGRSAIYASVASKELTCYRVGPNRGRLRFKQEDLNDYIERGRSGPKVKTPPPPSRQPYIPKYPLEEPYRPRKPRS